MKRAIKLVAVASLFAVAACAHAPTKTGERADLVNDAHNTLSRMEATDPDLRPLLDNAVGYIVFPKVGAAGLIVGGGAGSGVVFEHGRRSGFATVEHLGVGGIAGGQQYAELVIVKEQAALDDLKSGRFDVGANASAVILRSGVSRTTTFENGVAVVIEPLKGAMVSASIAGQRIRLTM